MVTGVPSPAFPRTTAQRLPFENLICLPGVPEAEGEAEAEDDLEAEAEADAEADDEVGGAVALSTYQTAGQSCVWWITIATYLGLCYRWCTGRSEGHCLPGPSIGCHQ
jgi:hypothetical protein